MTTYVRCLVLPLLCVSGATFAADLKMKIEGRDVTRNVTRVAPMITVPLSATPAQNAAELDAPAKVAEEVAPKTEPAAKSAVAAPRRRAAVGKSQVMRAGFQEDTFPDFIPPNAAPLNLAPPEIEQPKVDRRPEPVRPESRSFNPPVPSRVEPYLEPAPEFTCPTCCSQACTCRSHSWSVWGDAEFLLWWGKGRFMPPLATSSPAGTNPVLGLATTTTLFGNEDVGGEVRPGGRGTLGVWFDECDSIGVVGRFFALANESENFTVESNGNPVIGRPFFDVGQNPNVQNALIVADGVTRDQGRIDINSTSEILGGDVVLRKMFYDNGCWRLDLLLGYEFTRIREDLLIRHSFNGIGNNPDGSSFDLFDCDNEFHAGVIGVTGIYRYGCWTFDGTARFALGGMNEQVLIDGQTTVAGVTTVGGLLAQTQANQQSPARNIGQHEQVEFSLAQEVGGNLSYQFTQRLAFSFGYSFKYWSSVVQPGNQIDRLPDGTPVVDSRAVVGVIERPRFQFFDSDYWVHGFTFGAEYRY